LCAPSADTRPITLTIRQADDVQCRSMKVSELIAARRPTFSFEFFPP